MSSAPPRWDPGQYGRFEAERDRAALDLMLRLPDELEPGEIWDLGCGTGQHASLLRRRRPGAAVHGLDRSAEMLAQARALDPAVDWRQGEIADWRPERPCDLIFANASLHWVADHQDLFPRLARALAPGGALAVQMPLSHQARHHQLIRETAAEGPWADALRGAGAAPAPLEPAAYFDLLAGLCEPIDIWSTTYLHVLEGPRPVLEWLMGAALRPHLAALTEPALRAAFVETLGARLDAAYPARPDGRTLLPFPRLFLVARRR